jgi:hypothetical protein
LYRRLIQLLNGPGQCEDRRSLLMPTIILVDVKSGIIMDVEASRTIRQD